MVDLATVTAAARAVELAAEVDKDPHLVALILGETTEVVRYRQGVLIVEHRSGYVLANAGIDASNDRPDQDGSEVVLLLPENCNRSCRQFRERFAQCTGANVGVIINDVWDERGVME